MTIDFSKAPDWATHYWLDGDIFLWGSPIKGWIGSIEKDGSVYLSKDVGSEIEDWLGFRPIPGINYNTITGLSHLITSSAHYASCANNLGQSEVAADHIADLKAHLKEMIDAAWGLE